MNARRRLTSTAAGLTVRPGAREFLGEIMRHRRREDGREINAPSRDVETDVYVWMCLCVCIYVCVRCAPWLEFRRGEINMRAA